MGVAPPRQPLAVGPRGALPNLTGSSLPFQPARQDVAQARERGRRWRGGGWLARLPDRLDDVLAGQLGLVDVAHEVLGILLGGDLDSLTLAIGRHRDEPRAPVTAARVGGAHQRPPLRASTRRNPSAMRS